MTMSNKMDLSMFRKFIISDAFEDIRGELKKFDDNKCTFYYDESNNIRKLWLNKDDFNAPIDSDFVLGGVMHFGDNPLADFDKLKSKIRIQKSAKEIKFKHISNKAKTFLGCLNEDKVFYFLQWLDDSDLYIHCSNVNNLYYTIVDIIDSIDELAYVPFIFQMKNELYRLVRNHYQDFYTLLIDCNYPNIAFDDISSFYNHILAYIDNDYVECPFNVEILRQGLKVARKQSELTFLQGNPERTIIDNYFSFYTRPIGLFPYANHVFDNEYKIEELFEKYEFYNGNSKVENFCFVNSVSNPFVQISDCVVGLLGKYYTYINSLNIISATQMFESLSEKQLNTLHLLSKILIKSENLSKLLLHSSESIEEHDIGSFVLQHALLK